MVCYELNRAYTLEIRSRKEIDILLRFLDIMNDMIDLYLKMIIR